MLRNKPEFQLVGEKVGRRLFLIFMKDLAGTGIWINPPVRPQADFTSIFRRKPYYGFLSVKFFWTKKIWPELESNQRHKDFQSSALPTELSGQKII